MLKPSPHSRVLTLSHWILTCLRAYVPMCLHTHTHTLRAYVPTHKSYKAVVDRSSRIERTGGRALAACAADKDACATCPLCLAAKTDLILGGRGPTRGLGSEVEALVDEEYGEDGEEEEEVSTSDEDANRTDDDDDDDDDDEWDEVGEVGEAVMVEGVIHDPIHVSATPPSAKEEKEEKESYDDLKDRMVRRPRVVCVCVCACVCVCVCVCVYVYVCVCVCAYR